MPDTAKKGKTTIKNSMNACILVCLLARNWGMGNIPHTRGGACMEHTSLKNRRISFKSVEQVHLSTFLPINRCMQVSKLCSIVVKFRGFIQIRNLIPCSLSTPVSKLTQFLTTACSSKAKNTLSLNACADCSVQNVSHVFFK